MSPRPSTALPSETTATVFFLIVYSKALARSACDLLADAGDAGRVGHREVVARLQRVLVAAARSCRRGASASCGRRSRAPARRGSSRSRAGSPPSARWSRASIVNSRTRLPSPPAPGTRSTPCSCPPASAIAAVSLPSGSCRASSSTRIGDAVLGADRRDRRHRAQDHRHGVASARARNGQVEGANQGSWRFSDRMRPKRAIGDQAIARLAARQHGVVSVGQLIAAGIGRGPFRIECMPAASSGPPRRYALGHAGLGNEGRWIGGACSPMERMRRSATAAPRSCGPCCRPSTAQSTSRFRAQAGDASVKASACIAPRY